MTQPLPPADGRLASAPDGSGPVGPLRPAVAARRLTVAVGLAALAGGIVLASWRLRPTAPRSDAARALWTARFQRPEGGELALADFRGRWLLINFWATWCPPCVEEMPLLDRFHAQQNDGGIQVLGLAIDQPSAVSKFLARNPVKFPIGLAGLEGTDLGRTLGNPTGGLPFTVLIDPDGAVVQRKMGKVSEADLAAWSGAR